MQFVVEANGSLWDLRLLLLQMHITGYRRHIFIASFTEKPAADLVRQTIQSSITSDPNQANAWNRFYLSHLTNNELM